MLYEPTIHHIHENNELREYENTCQTKYKNKYPKNDVKPKQNIPEVTEKENSPTTNLKKYRKETYYKEKEAQSNRPSRSVKYLEMQRKLYNNFYVKPEMDFKNLSDKSNDKSCECENKKKSSNKLPSSNKVHDNYLNNLKERCARGVGICTFSSAATGFSGVSAAGTAAKGVLENTYLITVTKLTKSLSVLKFFSLSSIKETITSLVSTNVDSKAAASNSGAAWTTFGPYVISALVLILIVVALIILYIWLYGRRKNS